MSWLGSSRPSRSGGEHKNLLIEIPGSRLRLARGRRWPMPTSLHMISIPRQRIDHGDLLHREVRYNLDVVLLYDQHFLDAHAVTEAFAVLGFEREGHAFLNFDRVVERPDA